MILKILEKTLTEFLFFLPIMIGAIFFSQIAKLYIHRKKIKKIFKENEKNIVLASAVGISSPGPLLAYLPTLKNLKEKKLPMSLIVAFITGQTLIGPARFFLETGYFGIEFFLVRLVLSFFIALAIGTSFRFLEKKIDFYKR